MEKALEIVNRLVDDGVIRAYAIGGGVAATFYGEPTSTYDLDLFVLLKAKDELRILKDLYERLGQLGYRPKGEVVDIEGILVQFLPAYNELTEEALEKAVSISYGKVKTRIISLEHLMAIMIQTFRPKDKARLANFVELFKNPKTKFRPDGRVLNGILVRHGLKEKWDDFVKGK